MSRPYPAEFRARGDGYPALRERECIGEGRNAGQGVVSVS